jgi:hypothetical protein
MREYERESMRRYKKRPSNTDDRGPEEGRGEAKINISGPSPFRSQIVARKA